MLIKKEVKLFAAFLSVMSFIILSVVTSAGGVHSSAEPSGGHDILEQIRQKHGNTQAIKATVHQDRKLHSLREPIHITGTIILQKPGILRWEAAAPEKTTMIIDRKTITKYYPDTEEAEIYRLSDNFIARSTMVFFSSVMWGALEEMEKKFSVETVRESDDIIVKLVPLSKIVSKYLSSVIIFYSEETGMPKGFEVETPKGDTTVTRLEDIIMDPDIGADTFTLKLPASVRVRDYTEEVDFN